MKICTLIYATYYLRSGKVQLLYWLGYRLYNFLSCYVKTQAVSGLPLTMEDQIQCQTSPCEISCGQSYTEAGLSKFFSFPLSVLFHSCILLKAMTGETVQSPHLHGGME